MIRKRMFIITYFLLLCFTLTCLPNQLFAAKYTINNGIKDSSKNSSQCEQVPSKASKDKNDNDNDIDSPIIGFVFRLIGMSVVGGVIWDLVKYGYTEAVTYFNENLTYKGVIYDKDNDQITDVRLNWTRIYILDMHQVKIGDSGPEVRCIQQALKDYGYSVSVTGSFDTNTEYAVKTFQQNHNLNLNGVVDYYTFIQLALCTGNPDYHSTHCLP